LIPVGWACHSVRFDQLRLVFDGCPSIDEKISVARATLANIATYFSLTLANDFLSQDRFAGRQTGAVPEVGITLENGGEKANIGRRTWRGKEPSYNPAWSRITAGKPVSQHLYLRRKAVRSPACLARQMAAPSSVLRDTRHDRPE
jgi:hypothetical protein